MSDGFVYSEEHGSNEAFERLADACWREDRLTGDRRSLGDLPEFKQSAYRNLAGRLVAALRNEQQEDGRGS